MGFFFGWCKHLFVSELNNEYFTRQIFKNSLFDWLSLTWQFASILLEHCDFLNTDISQGSVATYLRCGGIFKYEFVANLP